MDTLRRALRCLGIFRCLEGADEEAISFGHLDVTDSLTDLPAPPPAPSQLPQSPIPEPSVKCCDDCYCLDHSRDMEIQMNKKLDAVIRRLEALERGVSYSPNYTPEKLEKIPAEIFQEQLENQAAALAEPNIVPIESLTATTSKPAENLSKDFYNMNHKYRGKCIVFSHQKFSSENLDERTCAPKERGIIKDTFEYDLGFNVLFYVDEKRSQIRKILKDLKKENFSNYDCIALIILSHGGTNGGIWAEDKRYNFSEIEKCLSNNESLVKKPKIILTQICRGGKLDKGCTPMDETDGYAYMTQIWCGDKLDKSCKPMDKTDGFASNNKIPSSADFFIVHSTYAGFKSFRQWFIPMLCKALKQDHETEDLDSIVEKVTQIMRWRVSSNTEEPELNGFKQVPCVIKTLGGKLYLRKKKITNV